MTFPKGTLDKKISFLKVAKKCHNLTTQERNLWARILLKKTKEKVFKKKENCFHFKTISANKNSEHMSTNYQILLPPEENKLFSRVDCRL